MGSKFSFHHLVWEKYLGEKHVIQCFCLMPGKAFKIVRQFFFFYIRFLFFYSFFFNLNFRFRNELPDPTAQPKLLPLNIDKDRCVIISNAILSHFHFFSLNVLCWSLAHSEAASY